MRRFTGTIPEDLIRDILLRVPSETLVGLKSVCKSWLALISSPNFAKSHLAITASQEKEVLHIVRTYVNENKSISLINLRTQQFLSTPHFPSILRDKLVGCACGIVCLRSTNGSNMYLWNPATNLSKRIPSPSFRYDDDDALGFGFDEINNDFKILRVAWRLKPNCSHRKYYAQDCEEIYVEVYSSNKNAWRKLQDKPTDLPYKYGEFHVTVNTGLLCCAGCYGIITFDLHTEVLTCDGINYPVPTFDTTISNINNHNDMDSRALVTNFNDSIAVIIYKRSKDPHSYKLNLWALDNVECLRGGGIEASWTLIFNIDVNLPIDFVQGYFNSGDLLLNLHENSWYLYNIDNKESSYFTQSLYLGQIYKYSKSLFTIPGFKQVNWNAPPEAS